MSHELIVLQEQTRQLSLINADSFPRRPWCSEDIEYGVRVRPLRTALKMPYIQANPPRLRFWMIFDIDRPGGGLAWEEASLPAPAWGAISRDTGRAHLAWALEAPVLTGDGARGGPLRYLTAIESAFRERLGADPGYSGLITKNPLHSMWRLLIGPQLKWELGTLAEWVDLSKHAPKAKPEEVGLGRNCTLFDRLRRWSYVAVRAHREERNYVQWEARVRHRALDMNSDFTWPLDPRECHHVAVSVARWTWRKDCDARERFVDRQAARGRLGGVASGKARAAASEDKRASAILMRAQGMRLRAIGEQLGVEASTVMRWLRQP